MRARLVGTVLFGLLIAAPGSAEQILDESHLSVLGFSIGQVSLDGIQEKLGVASVFKSTDYAPNRICYRSSAQGDSSAVVFEAGPAGDWTVMTSFMVVSNFQSLPYPDSCVSNDAIQASVATPSGLRTGLTRAEVEAILGPRRLGPNGQLGYEFSARKDVSEEAIKEAQAKLSIEEVRERPYLNISSGVRFIYSDGVVSSLTVYKVETW